MIVQDHLESHELRLVARGPLFIGSGVTTPKKEFVFNTRKNTVSFLNENRFFDLLIQKKMVEPFEDYCLRSGRDNLYQFLHLEHQLKPQDIEPAIQYTIPVGDGLDPQRSLKDISRFMRDPQGHAYVPGSSIKGAIRTALLFQAIQDDSTPFVARKNGNLPEDAYLHTLQQNPAKRDDAVNSIMRGIQIADSQVIDDRNFLIVAKSDGSTRGVVKNINLCRECVAPGTVIRTRITLDQSILKGAITAQSITEAIAAFAKYIRNTYRQHFASPPSHVSADGNNILYLGGGAGFFSKTLIYPYLGEAQGITATAFYLSDKFRAHHHDRDLTLGIAPHTMKYGRFHGRYYDFGACEVTLL